MFEPILLTIYIMAIDESEFTSCSLHYVDVPGAVTQFLFNNIHAPFLCGSLKELCIRFLS